MSTHRIFENWTSHSMFESRTRDMKRPMNKTEANASVRLADLIESHPYQFHWHAVPDLTYGKQDTIRAWLNESVIGWREITEYGNTPRKGSKSGEWIIFADVVGAMHFKMRWL